MTKRPLICILGDYTRPDRRVYKELTRLLGLTESLQDEARFYLVHPHNVVERDGGLCVLRGIKVIEGRQKKVFFSDPEPLHYLYAGENFSRRSSPPKGAPSLESSHLERILLRQGSITDRDIVVATRRYAESHGIPTNVTSAVAALCRNKKTTDEIISDWEKTHHVVIPRIHYEEIDPAADLKELLSKRYKMKKDIVLKPANGSNANGIAVIGCHVKRKEFEKRLKRKDITKIEKEISGGRPYLLCDFLTDTYLLNDRKVELRLHVVPYQRIDGSFGVQYAGSLQRFAPDPFDPARIDDLCVSLTYFCDPREKAPTSKGGLLEETPLYTPLLYRKLLRNAEAVVNALLHAAQEERPHQAIFVFDYLIRSDGEPIMLEVNSRGRMIARQEDPVGSRFNAAMGAYLQQAMFPNIIYQAKQYQQRRQQ